jgi:hypothetical protein
MKGGSQDKVDLVIFDLINGARPLVANASGTAGVARSRGSIARER